MPDRRIRISEENSWYWEYGGEKTLLLGASDNDCLFQWFGDRLTDHLDDLAAAGGNYVRNTMSIRTDDSVHPFADVAEDDEGDPVYDLDEFNDEYFERLETFLSETEARDIVVELTLWDQHDFGSGLWETQPWNPENNVNYAVEETGVTGRDSFFAAVENDVEAVVEYQERFVEKILDVALEHDNVIFNVNNESTVPYKVPDPTVRYDSAWERHWARLAREVAEQRGQSVDVSNMIMNPTYSVAVALKHPDLYTYVEISQLNQDSQGKAGEQHWETLQDYRSIVEGVGPRPLNNVKVYGATDPNPSAGEAHQAVERFWRLIVGGAASARFHRTGTYGLGLVDRTESAIRSARMLEEEIDLFEAIPVTYMLSDRDPNEAFCAATVGEEYAVYFPDGGEVSLDLGGPGAVTLRWLDADESAWHATETVDGEAGLDLETPGDGNWIAAIHVE